MRIGEITIGPFGLWMDAILGHFVPIPMGELKTVYVKLQSEKNQYSVFYAGHFSKCLL